ncbi:head-tail connector protein [Evansella cellulosilytica]|uniref:Phage gp6-like head-tail connector protein n=1 Tax=Evansella cellulosilytica (strain ATCC 21833 / DSM 2522 / FERM P-1141 / JCM 9156 / N-4) TaxID=649639 RepID=E6TVG7_EVAC2|nr:head-tail connector protein [Evansella cellulosilytica]ADU30984.1 hypothetical protein Bcell_2729 [Evansella cellulosilytica DSM 2522]
MFIKNIEVIGEEPVTLPEAKNYCRVDISEDDAYIHSLITAARDHIETIGRMTLIKKNVTLTTGNNKIKLPLEPFIEIESVKVNGDITNQYDHMANYEGECWFVNQSNATVEISYICGYEEIPKPIWQSILMLVGHWYDNRSVVQVGRNVTDIDFTLKALIAPYKRWGAK